ncbi:hypothetical protein FIU87_21040 [Bacillus sp. THAF10]|nr:hypothetical protein [Bacillus sp. THAF10]QFT91140.1 hypothetical protein FIU87_21040 [Bacillus sp. THAF10]
MTKKDETNAGNKKEDQKVTRKEMIQESFEKAVKQNGKALEKLSQN